MRSQSKGMGSADIDASMCHKIRTIPARLHCASHWQDNVGVTGESPCQPKDMLAGTFAGHPDVHQAPLRSA